MHSRTLWAGNSYWFTPDGRSAIAYRVQRTVALTTGGPIGSRINLTETITGFSDFCARHGWTPCLYSVTDDVRDAVSILAWRSVQVAEETIIPLPELAFTGKKWQDVRTALNNATKKGITAQWIQYRHAPLSITDQIRRIPEEWATDKGLPEMGFTLGGLDELDDDHIHCLIAVDGDHIEHGVTSWMPVYHEGLISGWTLDFIRRSATGFPGVMEFLIASAAIRFRDEHTEFVSLSGAPLARIQRGQPPDLLQKLLDLLDLLGRTWNRSTDSTPCCISRPNSNQPTVHCGWSTPIPWRYPPSPTRSAAPTSRTSPPDKPPACSARSTTNTRPPRPDRWR
jgi:phosphatidylglycerol lysyltransferase